MLIWKIYIYKACQTSSKIRSRVSSPPQKKWNIFWTLYYLTSRRPSNIICAQLHIALLPFFFGRHGHYDFTAKKNNNCQTFVSWDELDQVTIGDVMLGYTPVILWPEHPECNDDNDAHVFWHYCGWKKSCAAWDIWNILKPCKLWKRTTHQVVQDFFDQKLSQALGVLATFSTFQHIHFNLQVMHACAVFHEATRALALAGWPVCMQKDESCSAWANAAF